MINYVYPEICLPSGQRPMETNIATVSADVGWPNECPLCESGIEVPSKGDGFTGPVYKCGGGYSWKTQIQNHTDKWWGVCPTQREEARLERGRVCEGCGEKRLEGTGFPITMFSWTCQECGYRHNPVKEEK